MFPEKRGSKVREAGKKNEEQKAGESGNGYTHSNSGQRQGTNSTGGHKESGGQGVLEFRHSCIDPEGSQRGARRPRKVPWGNQPLGTSNSVAGASTPRQAALTCVSTFPNPKVGGWGSSGRSRPVLVPRKTGRKERKIKQKNRRGGGERLHTLCRMCFVCVCRKSLP